MTTDPRTCYGVHESKQIHIQISAKYIKACSRKVRGTAYFQYSKFKKALLH